MSTNKVKIGELTKQMNESADALLANVRRQQQQWRSKAQNLKKMEIALQQQAQQLRSQLRSQQQLRFQLLSLQLRFQQLSLSLQSCRSKLQG